MDAAKAAFEATKPAFGSMVNGLQNLKYEDIPEGVRRYIEEHPKLTALQLVVVVGMACPALTVAPALGWLGFGSAAAGFQSANGATWAFSGLQSAAMGGYGTAAVNGIVQDAYGVGIGVAEYFKWR